MEKKKMALCTPIPEDKLNFIKEYCDVTICGELKHGKGNVNEEMTREECMGSELVVLGDEYAGADTIKAWADAGMKFLGVAKGTPATVDYDAIADAGLQLSYTPGRNRVAVAEFTIGLMIAAARKITLSAAGLMKGEHTSEACDIYDVPDIKNVTFGPLDEKHPFVDYGIGFELYGKKLGISSFTERSWASPATARSAAKLRCARRPSAWRSWPTIPSLIRRRSRRTAPSRQISIPCFPRAILSASISRLSRLQKRPSIRTGSRR